VSTQPRADETLAGVHAEPLFELLIVSLNDPSRTRPESGFVVAERK